MKSKRNYSVYIHKNKINNKIYVGITSQIPYKRWEGGHGYKRNFFYNAIKKYGWNNFEHKILFTNLTKEEAEKKEIELIKLYKSNNKNYGYNICAGGCVNSGFHLSNEAKEKLRQYRLGKSPANKGKSASEEKKKKISISQKGKPKPKLKGRKLTIEHRLKLSKKIICVDTGEIFLSIKSACEKYNLLQTAMSNCLKKRTKSCKGLHWEYYNEEIKNE